MKQQSWIYFVIGAILIVALLVFGLRDVLFPAPSASELIPPNAKPQHPWRLAYYQGGDYIDYTGNLRGMVAGLIEAGWMADLTIPEFDDPEDAASLWTYLADHVVSDYVQFTPQAFWSANWDEDYRVELRTQVLDYLATQDDIDLVIAMGTWAGQDLVNDKHSVPTMALTSSNPIEAGIIESAEDSGYDHVIVEVDPERYIRQIRLFHQIVGFERLGVVYEDSPDGRIYANIADLEQVAEERGFELVTCQAADITRVAESEARRELAACYAQIAPEIDALWMGAHIAEQPKYMPQVLAPMFEHNVAVWSQFGEEAVRRGALLSIEPTDYVAAGRWYASVMAQILNGTQPRDINQVFEMPEHILINQETARRINFEVPKGILSIADEVYDDIQGE